jgi:predicted helicase
MTFETLSYLHRICTDIGANYQLEDGTIHGLKILVSAVRSHPHQEERQAIMMKIHNRFFLGITLNSTFRQLLHRSTNKWGPNATEAIKNQHPPVTRINLYDLIEAPVDWESLEKGVHGEAARNPKKSLRGHQIEAVEKTHSHFHKNERDKIIMACGTGKTFTALRIAEKETDNKGLILFLVPSISLLGQTLREWSADANESINAICICSDPEISRRRIRNDDADTFSIVDLALIEEFVLTVPLRFAFVTLLPGFN